MSTKDTIERAYGNIPKEPQIRLDMEWVTMRGIKYYWLKLIRFAQRR